MILNTISNIVNVPGGGRESLGHTSDSKLFKFPQLQQDEHHCGLGQSEDQRERGRSQHDPQQAQHHQASSDTQHTSIDTSGPG